MKKLILLLSVVVMIVMTACEKEQATINDDAATTGELEMNTSTSDMESRIEIINEAVVFEGKNADELTYTWVANLLPITSGGVTLSAVTVDGYDDMVYVGWHARGEEVEGEISVITVADPNAPAMIQDGVFPNQEFNDLEVKREANRIFFAGEADVELMSGNPVGDNAALAWSLELDPNGMVGDFVWERTFPAYSANSITYVANQTVWISMGSQGGLQAVRDYDPYEVKVDFPMTNMKHFDATGDYGVVLYGVGFNESVVRVYDMTNLYDDVVEFTIPYDVTPFGKNAVDVNHEFAYLAMGNDGIVKVNLMTGNVENVFDYDNGGFANGVFVDWQYVYAAYGADGLFVLDKHTFEVIGNWDYDGSCNYVKKVGEFVYLANGDNDGMIILRKD